MCTRPIWRSVVANLLRGEDVSVLSSGNYVKYIRDRKTQLSLCSMLRSSARRVFKIIAIDVINEEMGFPVVRGFVYIMRYFLYLNLLPI